MPYAHVNRSAIYFETRGSGPALLFVPGLGLSHAAWRPQLEHFSRSHQAGSYQTIAVDLRGAGRSGRLRGRQDVLESQAADLLALLSKLGVGQAVFCGSGYGAVAAQRAALMDPARCRALVLTDNPRGPALADTLLAPLHLLPGAWLAPLVERHYARWPAVAAAMKAELSRLRGAETLRARLARSRIEPERLAHPVLGVVGDHPGEARARMRDFIARVGEGRMSVLEDATAPCNLTQPYAFNVVVERFLRELEWAAPVPEAAGG